jgi:hypothetical protein
MLELSSLYIIYLQLYGLRSGQLSAEEVACVYDILDDPSYASQELRVEMVGDEKEPLSTSSSIAASSVSSSPINFTDEVTLPRFLEKVLEARGFVVCVLVSPVAVSYVTARLKTLGVDAFGSARCTDVMPQTEPKVFCLTRDLFFREHLKVRQCPRDGVRIFCIVHVNAFN